MPMGSTTHFDPEVSVALQGTLDTFALPDVLRLLAATKKSGRLRLMGTRGSGDVWVTGGSVCAIEASHAPHATEAVDALFELLRFQEGSFAFEAEVTHDSPGPDLEVESLLEQAEAILAEWHQIEAVVPSLDAYVTLRRTLDAPSVSISQEHWTTLVVVGAGATVRNIGDSLSLPEIPVSRALRDLAELGVIDIEAVAPADTADVSAKGAAAPARSRRTAPAAKPAPEPVLTPEPAPEPEPVPEPVAAPEAPAPVAAEPPSPADPDELPPARPLRARRTKSVAPTDDTPKEPERFVPLELPGHMTQQPAAKDAPIEDASEPAVDDLAAAFPGLANRTVGLSPEDEELARQLATLSPRAADAVRAAAEAVTDEEREAALDVATGEGEGSINRGLLLKFLSSVKS